MSVGPNEMADDALIKMIRSPAASERAFAWTQIYKRGYPVIRDLVMKNHGNLDDSQDIFQEGLAIVHNNILEGTFKEKSTIQTYLYSICRNLWMRELRRREKGRISIQDMMYELRSDLNSYLIDV
jgi:RNA polymerase sigma factor (sigma-70 family)